MILGGLDWSQAFLSRQATYFGNTGFGYGDSELISYSERLMLNFVEELTAGAGSPIGLAMKEAKLRYFNSLGAGSFSNYDEKILAEMTLYGLPMFNVTFPTPRQRTAEADAARADPATIIVPPVDPMGVVSQIKDLTFDYDQVDAGARGSFFKLENSNEILANGWRPVQPLYTDPLQVTPGAGGVSYVRGVLMLGGSFQEIPNDPVISTVVTEALYVETEPLFYNGSWYPIFPVFINRIPVLSRGLDQRLVVFPGQFLATQGSSPTTGVQRLYDDMQVEIFTAGSSVTDFIAPKLWSVSLESTDPGQGRFQVLVEDNEGQAPRVIVLYRNLERSEMQWSRVELTYDPDSGLATGSLAMLPGAYEYFVQGVDRWGNVSILLDRGNLLGGTISGEITADLKVTLAASPSTVTVPGTVQYTAVVTNLGPFPVTDVVLTDILPSGVSLAGAPAGCSLNAGVLTCALGGMAVDQVNTLQFSLSLPLLTPNPLLNTVSVSGGRPDPVSANNQATASVTINYPPEADVTDLALDLQAGVSAAQVGDSVLFTPTLTNHGPDIVPTGIFTLSLPADATLVAAPAGCTPSADALRCASPGLLTAGATYQVLFSLQVLPTTASPMTVQGLADRSNDPNLVNNSDQVSVAISYLADLSVELSASPTALTVPGAVQYTAVVRNLGPMAVSSVIVTSTLPAGAALDPTPAGCSLGAGNRLSCNLEDLDVSGSKTIQFNLDLPLLTPNPLVVTVGVSSELTDPVPSNNQDTASVTVNYPPEADVTDLALDLQAGTPAAKVGDSVLFTAKLTNHGPDIVATGIFTLSLPDDAALIATPAGCSLTGYDLRCTSSGPLAVDGWFQVQFTLEVLPTTASPMVVQGSADIANDPNLSNNTNQVSVVITYTADLSIELTAAPEQVMPLNNFSYTLVVRNLDDNPAANVVVSQTLPAWTSPLILPAGCTLVSSILECGLGALAAGGQQILNIPMFVWPSASGPLVSSAEVGNGLTDLNPLDNRDTVSVALINDVGVYTSGFETPIGNEWCIQRQSITPSGRGFLGEFGNEIACLDLADLPGHNQVTVSFDLYIIRSWNGASGLPGYEDQVETYQPDRWQFAVDGQKLLETTFSNVVLNYQSYPGSYPDERHMPWQTGAAEVNSLGYKDRGLPMDAVYRLAFTFPHTGDTLHLDFTAMGLQELINESWGLDNVSVMIRAIPQTFLPVIFR